MPGGRKPAGEYPLSNAERQARYRARCRAQQPPLVTRTRRPVDRRSRLRRWHDAVAELLTLEGQYAAWLAALPDSPQDTAAAEALQAIVDLDLDALANTEPPRGYGRDRYRLWDPPRGSIPGVA